MEVLSSLQPSPSEVVLALVPPVDCQLALHPVDPMDPLFHRQLLIVLVGLPFDFYLRALLAIFVQSWIAVMEEPMSLHTVMTCRPFENTIAYPRNSGHSVWHLYSNLQIATGHLEQRCEL